MMGLFITVISRIFSLIAPRLIGNSLTAVEQHVAENVGSLEALKELMLTNILVIIGATLLSGFFTFLMRQTIINVSRYIEFDLKNEEKRLEQEEAADKQKSRRDRKENRKEKKEATPESQ